MCILTVRTCTYYSPWMKQAKQLKNGATLHINTAEQLEKSNRTAATPNSFIHLPSRSTNSVTCYERVEWRASFDCAHPTTTKPPSDTEPLLSLNTWKRSQCPDSCCGQQGGDHKFCLSSLCTKACTGLAFCLCAWGKQVMLPRGTVRLCLEASRYDCYC